MPGANSLELAVCAAALAEAQATNLAHVLGRVLRPGCKMIYENKNPHAPSPD